MKYTKRILILLLCLCFLASCAEARGESNVVSSQAENSSVLSLEDASSVVEDESSIVEDSSVVFDNSSADESVDVSDTSSEEVVEKRPINYEVLDMYVGQYDFYESLPTRLSVDTWEELFWLLQDPTRYESYERISYEKQRGLQYVSNQLLESGYFYIPSHPNMQLSYVHMWAQCAERDTTFSVRWKKEDDNLLEFDIHHTRYGYEIDLESQTFLDYMAARWPEDDGFCFLWEMRSSTAIQLEHEQYQQAYYIQSGSEIHDLVMVLDEDYYVYIRYTGNKEDLIAFAEELQFEKYVIE